MIKPIITEKSLKEAKLGRYTFRLSKSLNKQQIKNLIEKLFGVNVKSVATMVSKKVEKRRLSGRKKVIMPFKKAVVTLKEGEKIDLFEAKK